MVKNVREKLTLFRTASENPHQVRYGTLEAPPSLHLGTNIYRMTKLYEMLDHLDTEPEN